jgi:aldehyde dehydrogenase (NAD+)
MPRNEGNLWATSTLRQRLEWLGRFRTLLAGSIDPLCEMIAQEVGKPRWEAMTTDVLTLLAACRWHEKQAERILKPRRVGGGGMLGLGVSVIERREPLGRIAIIATWNYPVQLLGIQLVQALIAGNSVVVKPSENTPRTQAALLRMAIEAGLPEGTLRWVEATREAGARLLAENQFDHIVFTGSTSVGRAIAAVAADQLTPTTLELSGRDSAIVLDDADAALAARSIWSAVTMNAGQTCMAPRRVLVIGEVYDRFIAALAPLAAGAAPRKLISEQAARETYEQAAQAVRDGGRSLSGVLEPHHGRTLRPLAIVDCPSGSRLVEGRHFGPAVAIVRCASVDEALAIHRACDQHLATSIFTRSTARASTLAASLASALVTINDAVIPAGHPGTLVAGRGLSGWGASRGREGLLAMTRPVTVTSTSRLLRPPTREPDAAGLRKMASMLRWLFGGRGPARSLSQTSDLCSAPADQLAAGSPHRSYAHPSNRDRIIETPAQSAHHHPTRS